MTKQDLILLPGTLCNHIQWQHQLAHLQELADIQLGDLTQDNSIEGMAARVLAAAPSHFALAAFSMGAVVAFEIMRQAPERVTRLALLDANPGVFDAEGAAHWRQEVDLVRAGNFGALAGRMLQGMLHPNRREDTTLVRALREMAEEVGAEAYVNQAEALLNRQDSRPTLPYIQVPTLLLTGREDQACPVALHEEMAAAIPNASLVVIEQSGHMTTMEQPQAVTAVLSYWLQCPSLASEVY